MIDVNDLGLRYRAHAERIERINAEGYRAIPASPKLHTLRRTLALAAMRAGTWLDPAAAGIAGGSERHGTAAVA